MFFALSLATLGNVQRAIELTREALATDPLRAAWYNQLARYSTTLNRLDEAERALHQAMELQPTVTSHYELLTVIEIQRRGDAQAGLAAAQRVAPGARQDVALASARQIGPDRGAAADVAALKTFIQKYAGDAAVQIADVYALRNDAKATFDELPGAGAERSMPGVGESAGPLRPALPQGRLALRRILPQDRTAGPRGGFRWQVYLTLCFG